MSKYKKGFVKEISNNHVIVECPNLKYNNKEICGELNEFKRCHNDEGTYVQQCKKCGNKFMYEVDLSQIYKGE